jgi:hypothetical protein
MHLGRLWEGQDATLVEVGKKVLSAGKPEAFLNTKKVEFQWHQQTSCSLRRKPSAALPVPRSVQVRFPPIAATAGSTISRNADGLL